MTLNINIEERPNGDVVGHIKEAASYATAREARYATALTASIKGGRR